MNMKKSLLLVITILFLFVIFPVSSYRVDAKNDEFSSYRIKYDKDSLDCEDALGDPNDPESMRSILDTCYAIMRMIAVFLTVILGMLDFGKAVTSDDQDLVKKASKKFIKRLVALVVIFILPFIIDPIVKVALGDGNDTCGVGTSTGSGS